MRRCGGVAEGDGEDAALERKNGGWDSERMRWEEVGKEKDKRRGGGDWRRGTSDPPHLPLTPG